MAKKAATKKAATKKAAVKKTTSSEASFSEQLPKLTDNKKISELANVIGSDIEEREHHENDKAFISGLQNNLNLIDPKSDYTSNFQRISTVAVSYDQYINYLNQ